MNRTMSSITRLILERAAEESRFYPVQNQPTVLSCGGMYLPRTRTNGTERTNYHVLHLPNEEEPMKIYVGRRRPMNLLYEILAKEQLN